MAGPSITVDIDDREVQAMLNRLAHAAGDLTPAFHDIGEYLKISHRERFERQQSPDGKAWQPLNPKYQARKRKNADKVLVLEGYVFPAHAGMNTCGLECVLRERRQAPSFANQPPLRTQGRRVDTRPMRC